ncbi:DUF445 family protein [Haloechinothrix sp. YIM 98757]|uniref:DUF445 family protein n=1 Tax=Haloechinothrix aidingensis TaxID=2752311 RepID=A0A838AF14_9PSEU|nr:DUF445 family protein [Haloechinothrix aidingensis]
MNVDAVVTDLAGHWPVYAAIPFIAALIGYVTNRVAVEMMFRPLEFTGVRPFLGWQGVVPRHRAGIAAVAADLLTRKLLDPGEVMAAVDPNRLTREIEQPLLHAIDHICRDVLAETQPRLWESLPPMAQDLVVKRVQAAAPAMVADLLEQLRDNAGDVLDLQHIAIERLSRDPGVLVRILRDLCAPELSYMARSGLYFGFLFGLVQSVAVAVTKEPLIMPVIGFAIGFATNRLAITMVFRPSTPVRFGPVRLHGHFHRRQDRVAADYAEVIAREVLTTGTLMHALLRGPQSDRVFVMLYRVAATAVAEHADQARPVTTLAIGEQRARRIAYAAATEAMARFEETARHAERYLSEAADIAGLVERRTRLLGPRDYEALLRPAFRRHEWRLTVTGGVIGGLIGQLQALLLLP